MIACREPERNLAKILAKITQLELDKTTALDRVLPNINAIADEALGASCAIRGHKHQAVRLPVESGI
jgi:hypothetical protein